MNGNSVLIAILLILENVYIILSMPIGAEVRVVGYKAPTARIIVHVRKRRAKYWDFWQLNSRICPPSLCISSDGGGSKPRGTAGSVFYNGDIVLDSQTAKYIYGDSERRRKRAAIRLRDRLWPKGIVYYTYADNISKGAKKALRQAMRHISEKTCIQFKKKKNKHTDYVRFISEPGCWSNVGRVGGEQKLSLGRGCEHVGTAIHELSHTLGFWHEQARPDRDKYVEVDLENVSPKYIPDFDKINKTLANSRGYPYDYSSIMHYNERTFTNNGRKTIKVIGIGKTLALRIGQRDGLSNIDIAQLRDMYYCNRKVDNKETVCPSGWIKDRRNCYKFINRPRYQFAAAKKFCDGLKSHLVHINDKNEDKFLKKYLKKTYKKSKVWRIGGAKVNGTFVWDNGQDRKPVKITYKNWPSKEPSSFSAIALARDDITANFEWTGVWRGSLSQMPEYTYSFICERQARRVTSQRRELTPPWHLISPLGRQRFLYFQYSPNVYTTLFGDGYPGIYYKTLFPIPGKCFPGEYRDGRDYRGNLSHTMSGITCQNWTSKYPHRHNLLASGKLEDNPDGLGDHNFCRNPKQERRNRPWCFTTKQKIEWEYCDVITCSGTIINKEDNSVVEKKLRELNPTAQKKNKTNVTIGKETKVKNQKATQNDEGQKKSKSSKRKKRNKSKTQKQRSKGSNKKKIRKSAKRKSKQ